MKNKKSLFLWADNTPYTAHTNLITSKLFNNMTVLGEYWGGKIVYGDDLFGKGEDHSK